MRDDPQCQAKTGALGQHRVLLAQMLRRQSEKLDDAAA
jgi:hypothetical protein